MKKALFYVFIFSCVYAYGQEIEGYTYDDSGRVPGVRISNLTQDRVEVSNPNGYFRVEAAVGDTVHFTSVAYDLYDLIVEKKHLEKKIVVELSISTLDEVRITGYRARNTAIEDLDNQLESKSKKTLKDVQTYTDPPKGTSVISFNPFLTCLKKTPSLKSPLLSS
ncbi:hypothetical protein [Psychroflexus tropicus]|uniref:hypothetical protein n=1 Tax=Psychroflexus tropicus TaxID=197345 RepID=UPI0003723606|nr:hypothetical protein [Psychroflexus tropicus]